MGLEYSISQALGQNSEESHIKQNHNFKVRRRKRKAQIIPQIWTILTHLTTKEQSRCKLMKLRAYPNCQAVVQVRVKRNQMQRKLRTRGQNKNPHKQQLTILSQVEV